jgi:hypothetical protein
VPATGIAAIAAIVPMETGFNLAKKAVAMAATFVTTGTTRPRSRCRCRGYFGRGWGRGRPGWGLFVTAKKRRRAD